MCKNKMPLVLTRKVLVAIKAMFITVVINVSTDRDMNVKGVG